MGVRLTTMALAVGLTAFSGLRAEPAAAQDYGTYAVEARVWLDRGTEPVMKRGERARVYYRVTESAFVSIFHIDTNGAVRMIFPSSPQESHYARGGRDYRVLFPESSYWYVQDDPGIGYFFIVASPEPFNFGDFGYSHFAGGWDLSQVGRQVYGDPYLAMDDYIGALIPDWEYVGYGLDFSTYHVERHHDYPRFLCYDCHGFQPYYSWNPYAFSCTSFRVVVYDDPYYYPATRYRGTRVVYAQPRRGVPHFEFKERATGETGSPQVVVRNTPPAAQPGVESGGARRAVPRSVTPSPSSSGKVQSGSSGVSGRQIPGTEGSVNRRSGVGGNGVSGTPRPNSGVRTLSGGTRSTTQTPTRNNPSATRGGVTSQKPVLQRRPTGTTRTPVSRPSTRVIKPRGGGGTTGGSATRSSPTVRSGGSTSRSVPTVRSRGSGTRSVPTVRSGGSASGSKPTVRSGGGTTRPPPRTTKPPPKVLKPRGGGGGLN